MNSTETRTARINTFTAYRAAADKFNAALTAGNSTTRLLKALAVAEEAHKFAQARHEQALRIEMADASERDIMAAALA